jgi:hypothetical protein
MKRFLLPFFALLFSAVFTNAEIITKTYHFSNPIITHVNGYHQVNFDGAMLTAPAGEPMLPYISVSLLVPPGHEAYHIEIVPDNKILINENVVLHPMQHSQPLSKGGSGVFALNEEVYQTNANYPERLTGEITTQYMNGFAVAFSSFTPAQYNPVSRQFSYYQSVTVNIHTRQSEKSVDALQNLRTNGRILKRLSEIAGNIELADTYPETSSRSDDYDLLIISPELFVDGFQQLVDFYLPRGIRAQIAVTNDIYAIMPGQDNQEKLRNYIIQEYQNNGIQHVTLGGDVEHIPYRGFYCHVQSSSVYESDDIPADLYYAALDGNWNDNGNERWGEIGEDDLLPEVGIGRFSVSTLTDFNALMNKTIQYQQNPVLGELAKPLLVGEWLYSNPETWGAQYLELLIGYQDENGYVTNGIPEDQNIIELFERDGSWSATTLKGLMNEGSSFIHHVGHANSNYTMKFYNSDITNSNFYGINGITHNYALIFSHGCICGAFDDNDCIAEKMTGIENLAVAVYMNSRYGWFNEGQTEGPAAHINRELVDAFYDKRESHLGMAYTMARIETAPWVTAPGQWEEGALRWNFYCCNLIGDACVRFWSDEPISMSANYQDALPIGVPSILVSLTGSGSVEGLYCNFMKDGVSYGIAQTNENGIAEIVFNQPITNVGEAVIYVSGYNTQLQEFPVMVIPNEGAYVVYASSIVNDSNGNNNGQADYNENILLTTELANVGTAQADNITATITSADSFVTITDATEFYGDIPGETSITKDDAFAFEIAPDIPDQYALAFQVIAQGQQDWTSGFSIIVNAPALAMQGFYIDDAQTGNNNGILDPGETANMVLTGINNGHAEAFDVSALLSSADPYITVNTLSAQQLGNLAASQTASAIFSVSAAQETPAGYSAELEVLFEALHDISFTQNITLNFTDFCFPAANCSLGDGFTGFSIGDINNMDNGCSNDNGVSGYGDFTGMSTDLEPGQTYTVSWETGYDGQQASLWIDLNSNKELEDNERLISDFELENANQVYTVQFMLPESVNGGIKRLRIRANWLDSSTDPCADFNYGETEDYTVNIAGGILAVNLLCNPAEICMYESSQLMAVCTGGTGNYTYAWTPTDGLSDPTIQNPVASPEATTTYTCEVSDGVSSVSSSMQLVVHPLPETPFIFLEGETLHSDAAEGNQWYDSQGAIPGANGQSYTCLWEDVYHVKVTNQQGCESFPSNSIHVVVTGINQLETDTEISIHPNPFREEVFIEFALEEGSPYNLTVYDVLGQPVAILSAGSIATGSKEIIRFSAQGMKQGIYFCKLTSGNKVLIRKIVLKN